MIGAGKLDQRISIEAPGTTKNAAGDTVGGWSLFATVWAEAIPLRGQALFAANQEQHAVDVRFRIRERSGITERMRIVWKGERYGINSIVPGTAQYAGTLELMAVKGVKDGR